MIVRDDLHKYLIIVAGGMGSRMGSALPKQFLSLGGRPILLHTIDRFTEVYPDIELIIVLPDGLLQGWKQLASLHGFNKEHHVVTGGEHRFNSVKNGLSMIAKDSLVAIHDAARPFVSRETIIRCFKGAANFGSGIPSISASESLRQLLPDGSSKPLDRSSVRVIQTPQVFRSKQLLKAYNTTFRPEYTDDATVVEASGEPIHLVEGNTENIKITTPVDLIIGEGILRSF